MENKTIIHGHAREFTPGMPREFTSLFAGAGFSSDGYHLAGFKEILAVELDDNARKSFKLNFPDVQLKDWDISKMTAAQMLEAVQRRVGEIDLSDNSPPCQLLSLANTKGGPDGEKNDLFIHTIKLIAETQPKTFLIENVDSAIKGTRKLFFNKVLRRLNKLDYHYQFMIANAAEFEVPQERRRLIIVGVRGDIHRKFDIKDLLPAPDVESAEKMRLCDVLPDVQACSSGQFKDTPILASRPACTVTKTVSMWFYGFDGKRRRPTIPELKIISSIREDFKLVGSFGSQWARIGNGVPPNLTKAFGKHILSNILTDEVMKYSFTNEALEYAEEMAAKASREEASNTDEISKWVANKVSL